MGEWKAVKNGVTQNKNAPIELYNIVNDPSEKNNVADKNPEIVKQMQKLFSEAYIPNSDWPLFPGETLNK
jgi:hypothetical protein